MRIGKLNLNKKVMVIAEIGNNHEGSFQLAKKLIKLAADSGADAVKFQTFIAEEYISHNLDNERFKKIKKYQLSHEKFKKLKKYASTKNLIFLSTPFDISSAKYLNKIIPAFKISSGDINFFPMIEFISKTKKPIILSTGISSFQQIKDTLKYIQKFRRLDNVALLHCMSLYPTPIDNANLNTIHMLKEISKYVGYSDHTLGIDACNAAVAMGARIIEKHFTIDNSYSDFRDHKISSDPSEFNKLIKSIRLTEKLISINNTKKILNFKNIQRSIVSRYDLEIGTIISNKHLAWVRPGTGIRPGNESSILGKKLIKKITKGDQFKVEYLK